MIKNICVKYDNPEIKDSDNVAFRASEIHDLLAKINEIIDVVNQLDKRLQKMPEFYRVRAVGGDYDKN